MATASQVALPIRTHSPIALWHLLSLDAPTVAALWVWFIARSGHIHLPLAAPIAMAVAVWMLYAADRLLDTRHLDRLHPAPAAELEPRHFFHDRHRRLFLVGIALAAIALAALLPSLDPAALHLYLIEAALLFAWFVILHATGSAHRLPKELAVGLFFSAAVFIPTIAREPTLRTSLAPVALLLAALCSLNCLFIYAWEHDNPTRVTPFSSAPRPHITTQIAVSHLPALAVVAALSGTVLAILEPSAALISAACALAALLLLALHRFRRHLSRTTLRAAADLALLTPLLFIPFVR